MYLNIRRSAVTFEFISFSFEVKNRSTSPILVFNYIVFKISFICPQNKFCAYLNRVNKTNIRTNRIFELSEYSNKANISRYKANIQIIFESNNFIINIRISFFPQICPGLTLRFEPTDVIINSDLRVKLSINRFECDVHKIRPVLYDFLINV